MQSRSITSMKVLVATATVAVAALAPAATAAPNPNGIRCVGPYTFAPAQCVGTGKTVKVSRSHTPNHNPNARW